MTHRPDGKQTGRVPRPWRGGLVLACAGLLAGAAGCVAQQADLINVEKGLNDKIAKLDKKEKDLQQQIKDYEKLIGETRARLNQDITVLRDADLPSMHGGIEQATHQVTILRNRVDDLEHHSKAGLDGIGKRLAALDKAQGEEAAAAKADREKMAGRLEAMSGALGSMAKSLGARVEEHDKAIARADGDRDKLAQQLETQQRTLGEQMGQYARALADYKKALAGLGEKLVQEEQRANELTTRMQGRSDHLSSKIENDVKAMSAHLNEVTKSVGTVAKALENVGSQLIARMDEQDRRLNELAKTVQTLDAQLRDAQGGTRGTSAPASPEQSAPPAARGDVSLAPAPAQAGEIPGGDAPSRTARDSYAKDAYESYLGKFRHGDLEGALRGFHTFLTQYPSSDLAANAQYWLGECYYGKRNFERAIAAFDRVQVGYPSSEKVPAALLKKGFAYLALKDPNRASSVWRQIVDGYPKTPEAGKAQEKLAQLKHIR